MFYLSKPQRKSVGESSKFVYKALHFASSPNTHQLGIQTVLFIRPRFSRSSAVFQKIPGMLFQQGKSKMAVSPYVSRAELWLANASFRPSFSLPLDFHPSIFLKWFPGHMAKGKLSAKLCFLQQNRYRCAQR